MPCAKCGKLGIGRNNGLITHHISYYPEITMVVCSSCHSKIHRHNPTLRRPDNYKSSIQGVKMQISREEYSKIHNIKTRYNIDTLMDLLSYLEIVADGLYKDRQNNVNASSSRR